MSAPVRVPSDDRNIELGTAINWRLIAAAASVAVTVMIAAVVLVLVAPAAPQKEPEVAQQRVAAAPDDEIIVPAQPEARPQPRPAPPPPVVWQAAPEKPKPAPKPVVASKPVPPPPAPLGESKPVQTEPASVVEASPEQSFKRASPYTEGELSEKLLRDSKELDIDSEKGTTTKLLADFAKSAKTQGNDKDEAKEKTKTPAIVDVLAKRDDLRGLPVRDMDKCQVPDKEAKVMSKMSANVRAGMAKLQNSKDTSDSYHKWRHDSEVGAYMDRCLAGKEWKEDVGVRMTVQMFQTEDEVLRTKMVRILTENKGKTTSVALAQRAVFDLHPDVRLSAILALKERKAAEYRSVLLGALRYPWSPVADNAAEALVALDDRDAVADLVALLDKPDPQAPRQNKDKKWVATELVRINHLGNCVLCHAPCSAKEDTVRGLVPERGEPLPVVYYESRSGNFVRADVTYLKQDFSVMHAVKEPKKWPAVQRFDYLVRDRELTADEVKRMTNAKEDENRTGYPQRKSVLWALRELTGVNISASSEDWKHYLECVKKQRMLQEP